MIEPEHHQRVRVGENPLVDRRRIAGLIDALKHRDGLTGRLPGDLLEAQRRAMEQLECAGDSLQEARAAPLPTFVCRPGDSSYLGHRREPVVHLREVALRLPGVAPGPVDADAALAARVLARNMSLVVGAGA